MFCDISAMKYVIDVCVTDHEKCDSCEILYCKEAACGEYCIRCCRNVCKKYDVERKYFTMDEICTECKEKNIM